MEAHAVTFNWSHIGAWRETYGWDLFYTFVCLLWGSGSLAVLHTYLEALTVILNWSHIVGWRETYGFDTMLYLSFLGLINPLWFICLFVMGFRLFSHLAYLLGGSCTNPQLVLCWCFERDYEFDTMSEFDVFLSHKHQKNRKNFDFFLIHSNSSSPQSLHVCKMDRAILIQ